MEKIINVGPMSSFNSLSLHLGSQLQDLRKSYIEGQQITPVWDLRHISSYGASISALTAFLSISKVIRDFIGHPIKILVHWRPDFQGFLDDIDFVKVAKDFDLYDWENRLGGYQTGKTNPKTKIFYYSDLPDLAPMDEKMIVEWKDRKRQEIKHSIVFKMSDLFYSEHIYKTWSQNLESVLSITSAELVVNSLLHGNSTAFVGVQRSGRGITATVCDAGVGFPKSMHRNNHEDARFSDLSHLQALVLAALQSKSKIGLYRAIDDVLMTEGYVIMSSYDTEIRWEDRFWNFVKNIEDKFAILKNPKILGSPLEGYVSKDRILEGYHKRFKNSLVGSRITFEIPFKR